ncbi:enoyl-CoA hydratase [Williamsia soli]|uniref:enoyl-CoA hydratase n=1 Tax=Williamsia soli TaxID=364929 RepID=UPI001A9F58E5|nr:enoyl-CoA hydratase [Williamsia soli]
MTDFEFIEYELIDEGSIALITLNRPRQKNAQNRGLLVELGEAFTAAEEDDGVRVVVLRGAGDTFSSGHDLGSKATVAEQTPGPTMHRSYQINGGTREGSEQTFLQEWHYFFENIKRWRDLRKITIASVQGPVYAGGLMLAWACDLIIAADDTQFADVVGTRLGMCGVEYFAHPWEFGPRKTKELMLTGDAIDADEAYRLGMVTKVFPRDVLEQSTIDFARRIVEVPTMTAMLVKESVNQTVDNMGFSNSLAASFSLHQFQHAYWAQISSHGWGVGDEAHGIKPWQDAPPIVLAEKDSVRAKSSPAPAAGKDHP